MPTIDADAHVVESERTWDYMDAADQKYRPIVVKPSGDQGGEYWFIDGKIRGLVRIVMTAHELDKVADRTGRVMFTPQETREMENVDARVKHMDELGIDIQVLYPTIFIEQITEKPEWEIPICKGYNRWLADIHQQGKGRLRWICVLPFLDMDASLEEVAVLQGARRLRGLHARHRGTPAVDRSLFLSPLREDERSRHGRGRPRRKRQPAGRGPRVPVQRRRQLLEVPHPRHRPHSTP